MVFCSADGILLSILHVYGTVPPLKSEDKIDDKSIARSSVILLRLQITEKEKKKSFFVGYEIEMSLLGYDLKITNFLHFLRNKKGTR